jgi:hypothetical protein
MRDPSRLSAATRGYGYLMRVGRRDDALDRLMDESLELAGPGDSLERAKMLVARALERGAGSMPRAQVDSDGVEALAMARRLGDPETLAQVLDLVSWLLAGSSRALARRQLISEELQLLEAAGREDPRA